MLFDGGIFFMNVNTFLHKDTGCYFSLFTFGSEAELNEFFDGIQKRFVQSSILDSTTRTSILNAFRVLKERCLQFYKANGKYSGFLSSIEAPEIVLTFVDE